MQFKSILASLVLGMLAVTVTVAPLVGHDNAAIEQRDPEWKNKCLDWDWTKGCCDRWNTGELSSSCDALGKHDKDD